MKIEVVLQELSARGEKIVLTVRSGGDAREVLAWVGFSGGPAEQAYKEAVLAIAAIEHAHPEDLQL